MNAARQLTVATIRQYRPHNTKRREIPDTTVGLYLIVQPKPTGRMSWAMRFRRPSGRTAKLTLGRVDLSDEPSDDGVIGGPMTLLQARALVAKLHRDRARGIDVIEQEKARRRRLAAQAATAAAATATATDTQTTVGAVVHLLAHVERFIGNTVEQAMRRHPR
jgi:Arm DNA-binding domain